MIEDDRGTLRAVAWSELFPWLLLFRCFRISIGLRPLLLSTAAALATVLGWCLIGLVFSGNEEIAKLPDACSGCPWRSLAAVADDGGVLTTRLPSPEDGFAPLQEPPLRGVNPILGTWEHLSRPFREVFTLNMGAGREFEASKLAYSLLCVLWGLLVWSFAGGAVTRDAVVQLASGERVGWGGMLGCVRARWRAYAWAPLLPMIGVLLGAAAIALLGLLLMSWNGGLLVAGVLWPLVLVGGFLMTLLLIGLAFGWPLMFATISAEEGGDSFDALSRSYAYVFQRPLHYLFYVAVATGIGALGWFLVSGFAQSLLHLTQGAACCGSGGRFTFLADPVPHVAYQFAGGEGTRHLGWLADLLIQTWNDCVRLLAVGYLYSYFWVSASGIYLLLRRDVDDTELDEVRLEEGETEEAFGLPEIKTDEAGAPVVNGEKPLSETE